VAVTAHHVNTDALLLAHALTVALRVLQRFVDELGRRDFVSSEMTKQPGPFRLVLNAAAAREIEWHCKHYIGRGVMRTFPDAAALAAEMHVSPTTLKATLDEYNAAAARGAGDPYNRKFFANAPFSMHEQLHVAIITPVVHCALRPPVAPAMLLRMCA
jgi:hypothetical protein